MGKNNNTGGDVAEYPQDQNETIKNLCGNGHIHVETSVTEGLVDEFTQIGNIWEAELTAVEPHVYQTESESIWDWKLKL